jgi:carboxyl-terminal processing protease
MINTEQEREYTAKDNKEGSLLKKISLFILFLIALLLSFGAGVYMSQNNETIKELAKEGNVYLGEVTGKYSRSPEGKLSQDVNFSLYWEVWDALHEKYVDKDNISDKELFYGSIEGMVRAIDDPYSVFMDPREAKKFQESLNETSFEGIGAEISIRDDILTVVSPLEGTPADKAGLRPGDKILAIDGTSTANINLDEAVQKIRGKKGTEVVLTIARKSFQEPQDIPIVRGEIVVKSVKTEMKNDIFIIEITNFKNDTFGLFNQAVQEAVQKDPKGIILDMRNNPGGYLQGAVEVASEWIENGNVVIEEFADKKRREYEAKGVARLKDFNTVVLINQGSASASEIVAGALQDHKEAVIMGEKSFGKGSVQSLQDFENNASVKITVAKWLTPSGDTIEEKGIEPDIKIEMTQEDYDQVKDPQLDKALELLKSPDFSIPAKTATNTATSTATSTPENEK